MRTVTITKTEYTLSVAALFKRLGIEGALVSHEINGDDLIIRTENTIGTVEKPER